MGSEGYKTPKTENKQSPPLTPEQQKLADKNRSLDTFARSVRSLDIQEAKLRVKDLTESLEIHKKQHPGDEETIKWFEREIALNQRVVNGEKLVDVLDSIKTDADKKRLEEAIELHKNQKMEGYDK